MKISRERIEQVREGRTDRLAPFFTIPMINDLLAALDERDELLKLCLDYIRRAQKDEPLTCRIDEFLRGTKWEKANG